MKNWLIAITLFAPFCANAQSYDYKIDLTACNNDQITVDLSTTPALKDTVMFSFPMTIPGTYATQNYGSYVATFNATTADGKPLNVTKSGENTFIITGAKSLKNIHYVVNDTWDSGVKKNKIFEPAGTNWEKDKNFVFNNSGVFGFFEGGEMQPFNISVNLPGGLYGLSVLNSSVSGVTQTFKAESYHQLVDCPILFARPDTVHFKVSNTDVTIGVYSERPGEYARKIYNEIKPSMQAIEKFVGNLPVSNYSFLIYLSDKSDLGKEMTTKVTVGTITRLAKLGGLGALEHGNSSLYYLADFGDVNFHGPLEKVNYLALMKDVAIHEFMHIFTPLNLHSEHIGNFNYTRPKMSKHLWLYEGVTEYFAGLIQVQSGLLTLDEYFNEVLQEKMKMSEKFPHEKMSFTEMSENVFTPPHKEQYGQVYMRGAIIGLMLDLEIIRLTNGSKTLKDVVLTLGKKYGANQSFSEASFIDEFVAEVHPDLRKFFSDYVEGRVNLDLNKSLETIGVVYHAKKRVEVAYPPYQKEGIKIEKSIASKISGQTMVKKVKKSVATPFQKGDEFNTYVLDEVFYDANGKLLPAGTNVTAKVKRGGQEVSLQFAVESGSTEKSHVFDILPPLSSQQAAARKSWSRL